MFKIEYKKLNIGISDFIIRKLFWIRKKENIYYNINYLKYIVFIILIYIIILIKYCLIEFNKYIDIFPMLINNKKPKYLNQIFKSRQLFINGGNISNDYIHYIRPINDKNEMKFKIKISKNEIKFSSNYFKRKKGQFNHIKFGELCMNEKLINNKKYFFSDNPLISVILPSFNKENIIMKSVRSIQNQSLKNIEIIIVDDCSTDNSSKYFKHLLETEPRVRIFTHLQNLGVWRSRIDGFLYSRGQYVIHFDAGDLYEDNLVLEDAYNIAKKYNLDSVKMFFRLIYSYNDFKKYKIPFRFKKKYNYTKIVYKQNIENYNKKFFRGWGNIWNRLTRKNILTKGLYLLNNKVLNIYKNFWEDIWWNKLINIVSYSFLVIKRFQYLYYKGDKKGEGNIKINSEIQRDNMIHEFIYFLYFDLNLLAKNDSKKKIIKSLSNYNDLTNRINLRHFKTKFYILDNLLKYLIKDPFVSKKDKNFLHKLLIDSIKRQNLKKYE